MLRAVRLLISANRPRSRSRTRSASGQATAEFGLVVTVLVFMMLGVVDFGRLVAMQSAAVTATREAARFGSAVGGTTPQYRDCTGIRNAAQRVVGGILTLDPANTLVWYDDGTGTSAWTAPQSCGGTARDTDAEIDSFDRIVVQITATYEPISPIRAFVGQITVLSVDRRMIVKLATP